MNLSSILENNNIEKRIAITPEIAKKYISLGFNLTLPIIMEYTWALVIKTIKIQELIF